MLLVQVFLVAILVFATWPYAYFLHRALRSGETFIGGRATRGGQPVMYWASVILLIVWVIALPSVALHFVFQFFL